jgi:3',5'-cyclic AMP phosphodiesterase CpdA
LGFLLAHLSDPHIGPLPRIPFRNLVNKRLTGALNWHGTRSSIHNMDVLAEIMGDLVSHGPDHVALTGDLVNVGYEPEFPQAMEAVRLLGPPDTVSIVPGNHDAYIRESLPAMERVFRPFMLSDGASGPCRFPYLRRRGPLALIGVNSGVPTLPFMATGRVGEAQREALAAMLEETGREGLFRVIMIHHPPLKTVTRFGRNLMDQRKVADLIGAHGAELVLHGHNHRHSVTEIRGKAGAVPIIGVASCSAVPGTPGHLAEYHLITIEPESRAFSLRRRGRPRNGGAVIDLGAIRYPQTGR